MHHPRLRHIRIRILFLISALITALGCQPPARQTPEPGSAEIQALLQDGRKIEAIKLYRQQHGVGLADAKAAVDRLESQIKKP